MLVDFRGGKPLTRFTMIFGMSSEVISTTLGTSTQNIGWDQYALHTRVPCYHITSKSSETEQCDFAIVTHYGAHLRRSQKLEDAAILVLFKSGAVME